MKLSPREVAQFFASPDPAKTATLIYGPDAMRIALRRKELVNNLLGDNGEEEMRLTRISAPDLRQDPAHLNDAMKAQGFFPGTRVVLIEAMKDSYADPLLSALEDWQDGDAHLVVSADSLKPSSKLRKAFEAHKNAYCVAIYADPLSPSEIQAELERAGLRSFTQDAKQDFQALAREMDAGDFRMFAEKCALYKGADPDPFSSEDLEACAPMSMEASLEDMLFMVAEAKSGELGPVLERLRAQGAQPVGLCMAAGRHFRKLFAIACDPGGPGKGVANLRPPVFGPRRDRLLRQTERWGQRKLEQALSIITETDLKLRSANQTAPAAALVERSLIRLAMLAAR